MKCSYGTFISYRTNDQNDPKRYVIHVDFRVQTYSMCLVYLQMSVTISTPNPKKSTLRKSYLLEFEIPTWIQKTDLHPRDFPRKRGLQRHRVASLQIGAILHVHDDGRMSSKTTAHMHFIVPPFRPLYHV